MHRIVFLDSATLAEGVVLPRPRFPHEWTNFASTAPQDIVARAQGAQIVVTNKVPFDAATIAALPDLRLIAIAATGFDHIDLAAARAAGIAVTNIRGYSVDSVPEHVLALILALKRQILPYVADVRAGAWQTAGQFALHTHSIKDLRGKRLGLFGSGSLGQRVAELGKAFGMEPVFAGRKGARARPGTLEFEEVMATSDVLSLHCPLNAETENMIAGPEFALMRKKPLLINTARGGLVDEAALERALDDGLVSGAGIDVTRPEPPPMDSAIMRLAQRPNVLVTPHIAWASLEAQQTLADQLGAVLAAFVKGERMNRLD
ncbi:D-2-hydroxyacid dehydrogenase [Rhodoblastus acidophilus]|uniref:D-2-hydroxyacid dehydrogenase n=1 Tax=Candidatus Rhodoblastus alkanivorans TaxID=2954117 RepID=A0ABS9Z6E6_9HYPH|nr:D-2-hydroxyacid dehydrogenase [Candidatus Rhodoblastus alkanivorans]MCI4679690.1 D-2-hydroxyacid dehydrogenase [Candidatus Rhodoblastus alkanivorans]MCI4683248.1 D-2-hydroxyacid dehydrogenase [Candidatus Rhodoblastus alkanivorans]MDI4640560.1 D-2-hydroxyacid dehydrogenase [Rhodoblastus acidophilus]